MLSPLQKQGESWATVVAGIVLLASAQTAAQSKPQSPETEPAGIPRVVVEFVKSTGHQPDADVFYSRAKEALWSIYPHDETLKRELVAYVQSGPDGPGLGFAGIALIPFHDPATVKPLLDRALDPRTSPPTRWCFLNVAPYILAIGDGIYTGKGKLDGEARKIAADFHKFAAEASQLGLGRAHAAELRRLFDTRKPNRFFVSALTKKPGYDLAELHFSAYVSGTLDLRDREVLAPLYAPETYALPNLMDALSFAANRDFRREILDADPAQITPPFLRKAAARALNWWKDYLELNPSGDWIPAVVGGFREQGYHLEEDLQSQKSLREILRAVESNSDVARYNAFRLLNHIFNTHFDLERICNSDKYALSFLEPNVDKDAAVRRLKSYWEGRLNKLIQ
jgi:hypothetical protein